MWLRIIAVLRSAVFCHVTKCSTTLVDIIQAGSKVGQIRRNREKRIALIRNGVGGLRSYQLGPC